MHDNVSHVGFSHLHTLEVPSFLSVFNSPFDALSAVAAPSSRAFPVMALYFPSKFFEKLGAFQLPDFSVSTAAAASFFLLVVSGICCGFFSRPPRRRVLVSFHLN